MSESPKPLQLAVLRLLRPLARILLRNGVPFGEFADLAKSAFIEVAERDFAIPGRKQTTSRISVLTGLTRKDVARLRDQLHSGEAAVAEREYNRAARVITGWVRDPQFQGEGGEPLPVLPIEGTPGFGDLVHRHSGDMPVRAVLDELERVGAVAREGDAVRLLSRGYVPQTGEAEKLHILGQDTALLVETIDHNLRADGDPRFQRKVAYNNLPAEVLPELRALTAQQGQRLLEEADRLLSRHDRDVNPAAGGSGRKHAGLGIYYFEQDVADDD